MKHIFILVNSPFFVDFLAGPDGCSEGSRRCRKTHDDVTNPLTGFALPKTLKVVQEQKSDLPGFDETTDAALYKFGDGLTY